MSLYAVSRLIRERDGLRADEIADALGMDYQAVRASLYSLKARGYIARDGLGSASVWHHVREVPDVYVGERVYLLDDTPRTVRQICEEVGATDTCVRRRLAKMEREGLAVCDRNAKPNVWTIRGVRR